jgi:hypothetical protein
VVGAVSRDEGDLGTRGEGGDGNGRRGFSPWLSVSKWHMRARQWSMELTVSISRVLLSC